MTLFIIIVVAALWAAIGIGTWFWVMHGEDEVTIGDLLALIALVVMGPIAALIAAIEFDVFNCVSRVVWRRRK